MKLIARTHIEKLINMRLVRKPVLPYSLEVCKFISLKGKRQASLSSADGGSLVTIVTCMNATITYVSPLLVFTRSNMKAELLDNVLPGSIAACHIAGWTQKGSFM
jgi:hypothetical protein